MLLRFYLKDLELKRFVVISRAISKALGSNNESAIGIRSEFC